LTEIASLTNITESSSNSCFDELSVVVEFPPLLLFASIVLEGLAGPTEDLSSMVLIGLAGPTEDLSSMVPKGLAGPTEDLSSMLLTGLAEPADDMSTIALSGWAEPIELTGCAEPTAALSSMALLFLAGFIKALFSTVSADFIADNVPVTESLLIDELCLKLAGKSLKSV
jgi:hypothetical protein